MANVIQILIEAKDNASAKIERLNAEVASVIPGVGLAGVAMGAAGLAMAGMGAIAYSSAQNLRRLASEAEQLNNLSAKSGTSSSDLQAMTKQLQDMGIQSESLDTALRFLQKNIVDNDDKLRSYGITAKDTYGALLQLSDMFAKMPDGANKTRIAMELLGNRGGTNLIPFLNQGSEAIARTNQRLREMGAVLDDRTLRQLGKLDDQSDEVRRAWEGLKTQLAVDMIPLMKAFADSAEHAAKMLKALHDGAQQPLSGGDFLASLPAVMKASLGLEMGALVGAHGAMSPANMNASDRRRMIHTPFGNFFPDDMDAANAALRGPAAGGSGVGGAAAMAWSLADAQKRVSEAGRRFPGFIGPERLSSAEQTAEMFKGFADGMKMVQVPLLKLTDAGKMAAATLDASAVAMQRMESGVAGSIDRAIFSVVSGAQTIAQAIASMMRSILQEIAAAAAEMGIGLALEAIGFGIGGPVGGFVGAVGGRLAGSKSVAPGGNTFVIQSISTRDALNDLISPTGSFRQANDRLLDIASAAGVA